MERRGGGRERGTECVRRTSAKWAFPCSMTPFGVSALEQKNGRCLPRGSYWQMTSLPRLKPTKGFLLASGILFLLVDGLRSSARPGASNESELPSEHQHLETKAAFSRSLLLHLLSAAGPRGEALETVYERAPCSKGRRERTCKSSSRSGCSRRFNLLCRFARRALRAPAPLPQPSLCTEARAKRGARPLQLFAC